MSYHVYDMVIKAEMRRSLEQMIIAGKPLSNWEKNEIMNAFDEALDRLREKKLAAQRGES